MRNGVDQLAEKWLNDPRFRAQMQQDLEGTVQRSGITLNAEEWAAVHNVIMTTGDEALRARISKGSLN